MSNAVKSEKQKAWEARTFLTSEFRAAFLDVFEPRLQPDGVTKKYGTAALYPKGTDMKPWQRAFDAAGTEKWGPDKSKWPKNLKKPFGNGDEKPGLMGYPGHIYINLSASEKHPPTVVDRNIKPFMDRSQFKSGDYARARVNAYAWSVAGGNGISFGFDMIQKTRDGEAFSKKPKPEDIFDVVEDTSDDESNYGAGTSDDFDELGI